MRTFKTTCSLDCWDQCALLVKEDGGKIISIEPDPHQPVTGNIICSKGTQHIQRLNHPDRLRYPLLKKGSTFQRISWRQALEAMAENIRATLESYGPLALLHFYDGGYGGILKNIESRFFSALGGCTTHKGSLCWGAGLAAQKYDFGAVVSHPHEDLANSNLIIIWGRNPAYTSIHLLPFIRQAREKGTIVILIDPVRTATAKICDEHIRVKPGSDGALALGMAQLMISRGLFNKQYVEQYCSGFDRFKNTCKEYTIEKTSELTGLSTKTIERLAVRYAKSKPAAIITGIGLQRHSNGGNTVRAIDALAALSGNIGIPGGGVSYANFQVDEYIDHAFLRGSDLNPQSRFYAKPQFAAALEQLEDPPVQFLYISRANPMVQVGNSRSLARAFQKIPFIVTADHFMTDTAAASDLILPCTTFLEEEDLYYNSMSHQYLNYSFRAATPPAECRSEFDYLKELADLLGVKGFPDKDTEEVLTRVIKPLTEAAGLSLKKIKEEAPLLFPLAKEIPWADGVFKTDDCKFNFYSETAEKECGNGLASYRQPEELGDLALQDKGFKYWFVTPHPRDSIHSSHRLPAEEKKIPPVYIHPQTAEKEILSSEDKVRISSIRGSIEAKVEISDMVGPDTVLVYQGWWHSSGAAVNNLTTDRLTDIGSQAAYYDCLCRIDKVENHQQI